MRCLGSRHLHHVCSCGRLQLACNPKLYGTINARKLSRHNNLNCSQAGRQPASEWRRRLPPPMPPRLLHSAPAAATGSRILRCSQRLAGLRRRGAGRNGHRNGGRRHLRQGCHAQGQGTDGTRGGGLVQLFPRCRSALQANAWVDLTLCYAIAATSNSGMAGSGLADEPPPMQHAGALGCLVSRMPRPAAAAGTCESPAMARLRSPSTLHATRQPLHSPCHSASRSSSHVRTHQ